MVNKYKSKGTRRVLSTEIRETLIKLKNQGMSFRKIAQTLKLDAMFVFRFVKKMELEEAGEKRKKPGHPTVLQPKQEEELANHLKTMAKHGFALSKNDVLIIVQSYCSENSLKVPFKDNKPGPDWFRGFAKRNKLSLKCLEPLEKVRKTATGDPFTIYNFYDLLEEQIRVLGLEDKPSHIYNLDETSLCADPSRVKLVSGVGQKANRVADGSPRENTTILACISASGSLFRPLIIFQGTHLWSTWKADCKEEVDENGVVKKRERKALYAVSENGWMNSFIFQHFLQKFAAEVKERPLLLVVDGHVSHLDVATLRIAQNERITILKLPSHATDTLQPLDRTCFKTLKYEFDVALLEWYRKNQRKATKAEFAALIIDVWHRGITPENIVSGFCSTGLFPPNRNVYPKERFSNEKLKRYEEEAVKENTVDLHTPECTSSPSPQATSTTASSSSANQSTVTFEDVLLRTLNRTETPLTHRKKLHNTAAVVTSEEYLSFAEKMKASQKEKSKTPKKGKKTTVTPAEPVVSS